MSPSEERRDAQTPASSGQSNQERQPLPGRNRRTALTQNPRRALTHSRGKLQAPALPTPASPSNGRRDRLSGPATHLAAAMAAPAMAASARPVPPPSRRPRAGRRRRGRSGDGPRLRVTPRRAGKLRVWG